MAEYEFGHEGNRVFVTFTGRSQEPIRNEWQTEFSEEELIDIMALDCLYEEVREIVDPESLRGSGLARELRTRYDSYPRGAALIKRDEALADMRQSHKAYGLITDIMYPTVFARQFPLPNPDDNLETFNKFKNALSGLLEKRGWLDGELRKEEVLQSLQRWVVQVNENESKHFRK